MWCICRGGLLLQLKGIISLLYIKRCLIWIWKHRYSLDLRDCIYKELIQYSYLNGGKTKVPFVITILRPWMLWVISWSSWYHSMVGGGIPAATHSTLAPVELENTSVRGGSILQIGAPPWLTGVTKNITKFNLMMFHYNTYQD